MSAVPRRDGVTATVVSIAQYWTGWNPALDGVSLATTLPDIGPDDACNIITGVQERFHCSFTAEEISELETLDDIATLVRSKVPATQLAS